MAGRFAMYVGSLRVRLLVREARTLKDKRQVVRSVEDRLRGSFQVAVAEVDSLDDRRVATLGIAAVGNEGGPLRGLLDRIVETLRRHPVAEFLGHDLEVDRPLF